VKTGLFADRCPVPYQRVVTHIVEKPQLQVFYTPLPEDFQDQNMVFFLRNTTGTFAVCVWSVLCTHVHIRFLYFFGAVLGF
jgi:hypothetical protein